MSNTQVIRPSELPEILAYSWAKDHPVLVMGPSGCGKSSIIEQQARVRGQELGYECFWKLGDPLGCQRRERLRQPGHGRGHHPVPAP